MLKLKLNRLALLVFSMCVLASTTFGQKKDTIKSQIEKTVAKTLVFHLKHCKRDKILLFSTIAISFSKAGFVEGVSFWNTPECVEKWVESLKGDLVSKLNAIQFNRREFSNKIILVSVLNILMEEKISTDSLFVKYYQNIYEGFDMKIFVGKEIKYFILISYNRFQPIE